MRNLILMLVMLASGVASAQVTPTMVTSRGTTFDVTMTGNDVNLNIVNTTISNDFRVLNNNLLNPLYSAVITDPNLDNEGLMVGTYDTDNGGAVVFSAEIPNYEEGGTIEDFIIYYTNVNNVFVSLHSDVVNSESDKVRIRFDEEEPEVMYIEFLNGTPPPIDGNIGIILL